MLSVIGHTDNKSHLNLNTVKQNKIQHAWVIKMFNVILLYIITVLIDVFTLCFL